jgi:hypothetical protein
MIRHLLADSIGKRKKWEKKRREEIPGRFRR